MLAIVTGFAVLMIYHGHAGLDIAPSATDMANATSRFVAAITITVTTQDTPSLRIRRDNVLIYQSFVPLSRPVSHSPYLVCTRTPPHPIPSQVFHRGKWDMHFISTFF